MGAKSEFDSDVDEAVLHIKFTQPSRSSEVT